MNSETIFAVVSTSASTIEITQEELDLIMKKRERDAHTAKRNSYIDEMNELLARAKDDGFTFAMEGVRTMRKAKPWGDVADRLIKVD